MNNLSFLRIFRLLFITFFVGFLLSAFAAYAGDAWYKTSWGMTPKEVADLIPEAAPSGGLRIPEFDIGGTIYSIDFKYDNKEGLNSVYLFNSKEPYACFLQLRKAFKIKYGKPIVVDTSKGASAFKEQIYEWCLKNTMITLTYSEMDNEKPDGTHWLFIICHVLYKSRKVDDKF